MKKIQVVLCGIVILVSCMSLARENSLHDLADALNQIAKVEPISIQKKLEKTLANAGINLGVLVDDLKAQELIKIVETSRFFGEEFKDARFEKLKKGLLQAVLATENFALLEGLQDEKYINVLQALLDNEISDFVNKLVNEDFYFKLENLPVSLDLKKISDFLGIEDKTLLIEEVLPEESL